MFVNLLAVLENEKILRTGSKHVRKFITDNGELLSLINKRSNKELTRLDQCPYHNTSHLIGVGMLMEIIGSSKESNAGILAGLYHDYSYSRYPDDSLNIEVSINFFEEHFKNKLTPAVIKEVTDAIWDTRFPYEGDPKTELGKYLRDADMLYGVLFCNQKLLEGLYEARKNIDGHKSFPRFLERNVEFISNIKLWTKEGKEVYDKNIENCIEIHRELYDLF